MRSQKITKEKEIKINKRRNKSINTMININKDKKNSSIDKYSSKNGSSPYRSMGIGGNNGGKMKSKSMKNIKHKEPNANENKM